jgi:DNA-binding response OmpR family regulator
MHSRTLLLVDDETMLLDLYLIGLKSLPYTLMQARGGLEALRMLDKETPALVVLDLAMPEIDGIQVLENIRDNERLAATKVVVLTAVPVMVDARVIELADEVLTKPIHMRDLQALIKTLLGD